MRKDMEVDQSMVETKQANHSTGGKFDIEPPVAQCEDTVEPASAGRGNFVEIECLYLILRN